MKRSNEIRQELKSLENALEDLVFQMVPFDLKYKGMQKDINDKQSQIADLYKLINQISEKISLLKSEFVLLKSQKGNVEWEIDQKNRELARALSDEALQEQFHALSDKFDRLTAGAPWREWAKDHQISGAKTLATARRGILGDKRGLGKTLTSLIFCDMTEAKKIIIFVPGDVISTFQKEIEHWAPHRTIIKVGGYNKSTREFALSIAATREEFILLINYEAWRKDMAMMDQICELQLDTVIFDEAHNVKDRKSIAFRGVEKVIKTTNKCPLCGGKVWLKNHPDSTWLVVPTCRDCGSFAEGNTNKAYSWCSVKNVLPMTGTPILNKPQDLFSLLTLVDPMNFDNERHFLDDFCYQDFDGKWGFAAGGLDRLVNKMSNFFVARDRYSAGVEWPAQNIQVHTIPFDKEAYPRQYEVCQQLSKHAQIILDEDRKVNILAIIELILRKRQAIAWPAGIKIYEKIYDADYNEIGKKVILDCEDVDESIKMDFSVDLIAQLLDEGERVVVFSQFKTVLVEMERRLSEMDVRVARYDGDTTKVLADEIKVDLDRKYTDPAVAKFDVVLANYKKGGVGLNFTGVTQMIIFDEEWNPGKNDQAYGRIDRMGQTEETTVHILRVENSVDDWMAGVNEVKANMISGFESEMSVAQDFRDKLRKGEML